MPPASPIIHVDSRGIHVPLGGVARGPEAPLLKTSALSFRAGTVTVLLGVNGSGKTTLLRTLAGLVRPIAGSVQLDGQPVHAISPRTRAQRIAYIAQRSDVSEAFSAREVAALGLFATEAGDDRAAHHAARIEQALALVDAAHLAQQAITTLSAGEKQRVALARALVQLGVHDTSTQNAGRERVLLADEPTSAMDPMHALRTLALLQHVAKQGVAVVLAMHDVALALRLCQHVVLLARDGSGHASVALTSEVAALDSATLGRVMHVAFADVSVLCGTDAGKVVRAGYASTN